MPPAFKIVLLLLALAAAFVVRVEWLVHQDAGDTSLALVGTTAQISGIVSTDPDNRDTGTRVVVGTTLVVLPPHTSIAYGDTVTVRGSVEAPQSFLTNTGHTFDYASYLRVRGVRAVMQRAQLVQQSAAGFSFVGLLYDIKHIFERSLERVVEAPQSALLEGMLLGERGTFPPELLQIFVIVGLIHIVVLSGSNISIVAEGVFRSLSFLPRRALYVVGGAVIVLFAVMVGGGAATVRAVIMAAIAILARYMRRPNSALRALGVAAVLMLLWNPLNIFDNGFVLSILATFGLISIAPAIETKLTWLPAWGQFNLRSIVATTLAVEVLILPALLYFSGVLSFVSIPINAVILPFVPVVMFFGFISGVLAFVHPIFALVPALVTDFLLRAMIFVAQTTASLPAAYITVAEFPLWLLLVVYVPLISAASYLMRRTFALSQTN